MPPNAYPLCLRWVPTVVGCRLPARAVFALQDSATLAGELLSAAHGERSLIDAVSAYERVMLPRGFDTVDNSLRIASQMFGKTD